MKFVGCNRDCFDGCSLIYDNGKLRGNEFHPFTKGFVCRKGSYLLESAQSPKRIRHALISQKGIFKKSSTDIAFDIIAKKIMQKKEIIRIDYAGTMGLLGRFFHQRVFNFLGAPNLLWDVCSNAGEDAIMQNYGIGYGKDISDMENADFVIVWGANPKNSSIHTYSILKKLQREGAEVIVIDPIKSETAKEFSHISVLPGGDVALALQIFILLKENGLDIPIDIETSFSSLSKISGILFDEVEKIVNKILFSNNPFIFIGYGFQREKNGGSAVRLISLIPYFTHKKKLFYYDRPAQGVDIDYVRGKEFIKNDKTISLTQLGTELESIEDAVIFILNVNPVTNMPQREKIIKGLLKKSNFVVVHELFMTETAQCADIVLPAASILEYNELIPSYGHKYLNFNEKVLEKNEDILTNMELARKLAEKLGLTESKLFESDEEIIKRILENLNYKVDDIKEKGFVELPEIEERDFLNLPKWSEIESDIENLLPKEGEYLLLTPVPKKRIHGQYFYLNEEEPLLEVSEDVAKRENIKNGEIVEIYNDFASVKFKVFINSDLKKEILRIEHGFARSITEKSLNSLISDSVQKYGHGSTLNTVYVKLRKV